MLNIITHMVLLWLLILNQRVFICIHVRISHFAERKDRIVQLSEFNIIDQTEVIVCCLKTCCQLWKPFGDLQVNLMLFDREIVMRLV